MYAKHTHLYVTNAHSYNHKSTNTLLYLTMTDENAVPHQQKIITCCMCYV